MENKLFGAKFDQLDRESTIKAICNAIEHNKQIFHRGDINVSTVIMGRSDPEFMSAINDADIVNIDGMGAIFGAHFLGLKTVERVAGVDLFLELLHVAAHRGYSVYFLGASDLVLEKMLSVVRLKFPNLIIAGSHNGYFWEDIPSVVESINRNKPDMTFVGIKSPEKEMFIYEYKNQLSTKFIMGVGGSFDVLSGKVKRAPSWMQQCGLEWLFRVMQEPRRMWKRYLLTNSKFAWLLLTEKIKNKFGLDDKHNID